MQHFHAILCLYNNDSTNKERCCRWRRKKPVIIIYHDDIGWFTVSMNGQEIKNIVTLEIKVSNMRIHEMAGAAHCTVEQYLPRLSAKHAAPVAVLRNPKLTREAKTMTLQEAAARAYARDTTIYRACNPPGWKIKPTDLLDCLTCILDDGEEAPRWQPTLADLLAEDWLVTE